MFYNPRIFTCLCALKKWSVCLQVTFTVDIRAMDDVGREAIIYELSKKMYQICDRRSISCVIERKVRDFYLILCLILQYKLLLLLIGFLRATPHPHTHSPTNNNNNEKPHTRKYCSPAIYQARARVRGVVMKCLKCP